MKLKNITVLLGLLISDLAWAGVSPNSTTCDVMAQMADQIYALRVEGHSAKELTKVAEQYINTDPYGFEEGSDKFLFLSDMIQFAVQIGNLSYEQYPDPAFREQRAREACVSIADSLGYSEGK